MSVDYERLKLFVKEAMAVDGPGGVMVPSGPAGVPHRMPAADTAGKEQDMGDPAANEMYNIALAAREATEDLVEALDNPIYDEAYEHAFKASAALRRTLNSLEESGAHPMPSQRVVAPPRRLQKWGGHVPYAGALTYGANSVAAGMVEAAKLELAGDAQSPKVQQLISIFMSLPVKDKQAFSAFITGTAAEMK